MKMLKKTQIIIEDLVEKRPLGIAIWSILIIAIICLLLGAFILIPNANKFQEYFNVTKTGPLGDSFNGLLGPFIAYLVAILTFLAFYIQYKANVIQNKANELLQFENKFYDLIKLHRDNVYELRYSKYNGEVMETSESRKVFRVIFKEFMECFHEVQKFAKVYDSIEIFTPDYKEKLKVIMRNNNCKADIYKMAMIDISYCIVFFGLSKESDQVFLNLFWNRYNKDFINRLKTYLTLKPRINNTNIPNFKAWVEFRSKSQSDIKKILNELHSFKYDKIALRSESAKELSLNYAEVKYYGGHQHRLGHYFRHLFQSYKFISSQYALSPKEKYFYGKTLRAQLSTYEQFLLFVNSLSSLGMKWEYTAESGDVDVSSELILEDFKFITKYNLIKNLPGSQYFDFTYREYYPAVNFEYREDISYT